jgi:hypothetical protein
MFSQGDKFYDVRFKVYDIRRKVKDKNINFLPLFVLCVKPHT